MKTNTLSKPATPHLPRRAVVCLLLALAVLRMPVAAAVTSFPASFDPFPYAFGRVGAEYQLTAGTGYTFYYFAFEHTVDLLRPFSTLALALGSPAPAFGYTPEADDPRGFFRLAAIDIFSPRDTDGDGMDDLWELTQGLDGMDPADALLPSTLDPSKTNLEYYRTRFGLSKVTQFISEEVSIYNQGFAFSPEVAVFNFPNASGVRLEGVSPEVSVFNTAPFTGFGSQAFSQEVSVFNTAAFTAASVQAFSPEVSVFNTAPFSGAETQGFSEELSVFNASIPTGPATEATSSEISVLNQ